MNRSVANSVNLRLELFWSYLVYESLIFDDLRIDSYVFGRSRRIDT